MATDEQLARRVGELEQTVRELEEQNVQLRKAAFDFGALAERLNGRLKAERRASPKAWPNLRLWFYPSNSSLTRFRGAARVPTWLSIDSRNRGVGKVP